MSGLSSSYVSGVFFFVQFRLGITDDVLRKVERVQSIGLEQKRNYLNACGCRLIVSSKYRIRILVE